MILCTKVGIRREVSSWLESRSLGVLITESLSCWTRVSGGIPVSFLLLLSRWIFFINNLKDDTIYPKTWQALRQKREWTSLNGYTFFNTCSHICRHILAMEVEISSVRMRIPCLSSAARCLLTQPTDTAAPVGYAVLCTPTPSQPPPFLLINCNDTLALPTNGSSQCQANPTAALELLKTFPGLGPCPGSWF